MKVEKKTTTEQQERISEEHKSGYAVNAVCDLIGNIMKEIDMGKYNLKSIMLKAWEIFRKTGKSFAECLKMAWFNAKAVATAKQKAGVDEETHSWYAWKMLGMEVIHESKALFKAVILDDKTKSGTRIVSYFGSSQVQPM